MADDNNENPKEGKLRAFAGNSIEDYYSRGMKDYPLPARAFYGVVVGVVGAFTKLFWPWTLEDADKMVNDGRGRMVIMNHVSMLDPIILIVVGYSKGLRVRPIFKSEFNVGGVVDWFFSRAGGIPVNRGTADMKAVRRARAALERGEYVLVFPEGTRIKDDEEHPIHGGFALMAQLAKAPVLPTAIVGARDITPAGKRFPRLFKRVFAKVGDSIEFSSLGVEKKKEQVQAMEKRAMKEVWRLRDELRAEHPGKM